MPDPATLAVFVATAVLLTLAPGPDILYLLSQSLANGRAAGIATALGLAAGNLVHTLAAAAGASVIFRSSPLAFAALKWAGVSYLLWLAWQGLRARPADASATQPPPVDPPLALFRRGFTMNVLNPKVALFFLALLPQFTDPEFGPIAVQMVILGLVFTVQVIVVFGAVAVAAAALGQMLAGARGGRFQRWGNYLVTCVFIALAIRLALVSQT